MNDEYNMRFLKGRIGPYLFDFIRPYLEKYAITIDPTLSTDADIRLVRANGEYAGKITRDERDRGAIKYTVILNEEGTLILSGVARGLHVSGALEKMNDIARGDLESFSTVTASYYGTRSEFIKSHYSENVPAISRELRPMPLNWTWNEINALFITQGNNLIPTHSKKMDDVSSTEFMEETLRDFTPSEYTGQRTV